MTRTASPSTAPPTVPAHLVPAHLVAVLTVELFLALPKLGDFAIYALGLLVVGAACLLVMSAYFDEPRAERARAYGAAELLEKGKLAETLQPAIERCMGPKWRAAGQ